MSKVVLVMDTPEKCMECSMLNGLDECILQDDDINFNAETWGDLRAGCPLVPMPEKKSVCGKYPQPDGITPSYKVGWNDCIDAIMKKSEKTECDARKQSWIPVTEQLPEEDEPVLIQVSGKPQENIIFDNVYEFASYSKEEGWILDNYPEWRNPDVIAWATLPEPYKPKAPGDMGSEDGKRLAEREAFFRD